MDGWMEGMGWTMDQQQQVRTVGSCCAVDVQVTAIDSLKLHTPSIHLLSHLGCIG